MQSYALKQLAPIQIVELTPSFVYENYLKSKKVTSELSALVSYEYDSEDDAWALDIADNPMAASNTNIDKSKTDVNYNISHSRRH